LRAMGVVESCQQRCHPKDRQDCTDIDGVETRSSSTSSWRSVCPDELQESTPCGSLVICGLSTVQDSPELFQWVPAKGWDSHARALKISACNTCDWDGTGPIPTPAPGAAPWLLPCSDTVALRIAQRQRALQSAGWKVISSPPHIIQSLGDKAELPKYAARLGRLEMLPRHFERPEKASFPCILKPAQGEFGKDACICQSPGDVYDHAPNFSKNSWVLQELVPGDVEFSVSLLVSFGTILDVVGMRYRYDREVYIWPGVVEVSKELVEVPVQHLQVLASFVAEYDGILNFNYKLRPDGRICIFEANTRIGADLACDAPRDRARQLFLMLDKIRG